MSAEVNKQAVEHYFSMMASGSPDVPSLFTDDITWWVPQSSPFGGTYVGRDAVLGLMGRGTELYDLSVPMQTDIEQMVAEGDTVCVQLVLRARTAAGAEYENQYHFVFRLREGKICAVKEYVDTLYVQRMLFEGASQ